MDHHVYKHVLVLLAVGAVSFVAGWLAQRRATALKTPSPVPKLLLPEMSSPVVPTPLGWAHSCASLATLLAGIEYVRARLAAVPYSLDSTDCHALAWLLEALAPLPAAVTGNPLSDSETIKRCLADLDVAIGPGSWWLASQRLNRETSATPGAPKPEVPVFVRVYDSFVVSQARARADEQALREVGAH